MAIIAAIKNILLNANVLFPCLKYFKYKCFINGNTAKKVAKKKSKQTFSLFCNLAIAVLTPSPDYISSTFIFEFFSKL